MERRNEQGGSLFQNSGEHLRRGLISGDPLAERHKQRPRLGGLFEIEKTSTFETTEMRLFLLPCFF